MVFTAEVLTDALRDLVSTDRARKRRSCRRATGPRSISGPQSGARSGVASWVSWHGGTIPRCALLHTASRRGREARVSCRKRTRLNGARRAADTWPDEACGALGRIRWVARSHPQSSVPAHVRGGEGCTHADRHRHRFGLDGRRLGQARGANLRLVLRSALAPHRRGRDSSLPRATSSRASRDRSRWPTARSSAVATSRTVSVPRRSRWRTCANGFMSSISSLPARRVRCPSSARACWRE